MKTLKEFDIQFVGLKLGEHCFEYKIGKKFFNFFEYTEFNDANVDLIVVLNKKSTFLEFHFKAKGTVNVFCDLTNEVYNQPIESCFDLVVNFGENFNDDNEEILIVSHSEYEINIAQYIYELIVLAIPSKKIHPGIKDGTLHSDILDKLEELSLGGLKNKKQPKDIDPRWNTLKKLVTDK